MFGLSPHACSYNMSDSSPCGRPLHNAAPGVDPEPRCLMHSFDPEKDHATFQAEIDAIMDGTSSSARRKDVHDFTGFVFPGIADFLGARFIHDACFWQAHFKECANFPLASFHQNADFSLATFDQFANFSVATFNRHADFTLAAFHQIADFTHAQFLQPEGVLFRQVNQQREDEPVPAGLRARFLRCNVEEVQFSNVNWRNDRGRMVLQDEFDVQQGTAANQQLVVETYHQLVANFESARSYHLAEDCIIGALELSRLDPRHFPFGRFRRPNRFYKRHRWARRIGEQLSVLNLYRLSSKYGSSYQRAFFCLVLLVFIFAGLFAIAGLRLAPRTIASADSPTISISEVVGHGSDSAARRTSLESVFTAGLLQSVEVATFQRAGRYEPASASGHFLVALETAAIPGQLTLLLLALRRRFRV
jgi:hypothetical protein